MNGESIRLVQLGNLATMEADLEKLKKKYEKSFRDWLKKPGEYLLDPKMLFALFSRDAVEYKELHLKVKHVKGRLYDDPSPW